MTIKNQLIQHIESLQRKADREAGYTLYPKHQCLLPNDAVYLTRYTNLSNLCALIETLVTKSGKSLEVITLSIAPNKAEVLRNFSFIEEALEEIIRHWGTP